MQCENLQNLFEIWMIHNFRMFIYYYGYSLFQESA